MNSTKLDLLQLIRSKVGLFCLEKFSFIHLACSVFTIILPYFTLSKLLRCHLKTIVLLAQRAHDRLKKIGLTVLICGATKVLPKVVDISFFVKILAFDLVEIVDNFALNFL